VLEMQDPELFLSLAEIAGVFVGFGALIAIRSGDAIRTGELTSLRWVMSTALWVVIAGLCPVLISRYGVAVRELWLAAGILALVLFAVIVTVNAVAPENLSEVAVAAAAAQRARAGDGGDHLAADRGPRPCLDRRRPRARSRTR
jgi:hypothetical protein